MKNLLATTVIAVLFVLPGISFSQSGFYYKPELKFNSKKNYAKEKLLSDYNKAKRISEKNAGSLLGASIDFQLGYNSTNANIEATGGKADYPTDPKAGFTLGALINFSLFGSANFTTGIDFIKKNFEVDKTNPSDTLGDPVSEIEEFTSSYFNIPINFNVGTMISDNVGVNLSFGPYLAFRMNDQSIEGFGYKNFDLGLNGILTVNYMLNQFMGIILGGKYQRGGLNNLASTAQVEKTNTNMWGVFTGFRIGVDL
ncbi:MAG: hypothetical protein HGGPFJEG_00401 [Ignavibacteria bacterium]|nr:hypothetical protein [Ignavibacteria bacterium]